MRFHPAVMKADMCWTYVNLLFFFLSPSVGFVVSRREEDVGACSSSAVRVGLALVGNRWDDLAAFVQRTLRGTPDRYGTSSH